MNLTNFQAMALFFWASPALISAFRHGPRLIGYYLRDRKKRAEALDLMQQSGKGPRGAGYFPYLTWGHVAESAFRCLCPIWNIWEALIAVIIVVSELLESGFAALDAPVVKLKPKKEKK